MFDSLEEKIKSLRTVLCILILVAIFITIIGGGWIISAGKADLPNFVANMSSVVVTILMIAVIRLQAEISKIQAEISRKQAEIIRTRKETYACF